jgi:tRNA(Arg) A34 adenosine deaminase TadA
VGQQYPNLVITLPEWVSGFMAATPAALSSPEERMTLAISLARENVKHGGGPFGAVVVESDGGRVVAPGMNLVVPLNCSLAHAEMVAIAIAQQLSGSFDLGAPGLPGLQLVTSAEPCAMCLGAIPWSGVRSVICGASAEDAQRIGFDEGDKPAGWLEALARRGIEVRLGVCRDEAARVLLDYGRAGGRIYNSRA